MKISAAVKRFRTGYTICKGLDNPLYMRLIKALVFAAGYAFYGGKTQWGIRRRRQNAKS
jgi:hypothetical protein